MGIAPAYLAKAMGRMTFCLGYLRTLPIVSSRLGKDGRVR
jgi:hypothetical protein